MIRIRTTRIQSVKLMLAAMVCLVLLEPVHFLPRRPTTALLFATAYRKYLKYLPNAMNVICPNGVDCWSGPCGGFGHTDCRTGGDNSFGKAYKSGGISSGTEGKRTSTATSTAATLTSLTNVVLFGQLPTTGVEEGWSTKLCLQDSDGDGKTNGDELGDPCCMWNAGSGSEPEYVTDITSPGHFSSKTSRASCLLQPPLRPTALAVETVGQSTVVVSWQLPAAAAACICSVNISVTYLSSGERVQVTSLPKFQGNSATLAGLRSDAGGVVVSVMALNYMNSSNALFNASAATATTSSISLLAQASAVDNGAVTTSASPTAAVLAGTLSYSGAGALTALEAASVALMIVLVASGLVGPLLLHRIKDPRNRWRHVLYHTLVVPGGGGWLRSVFLPLDVRVLSWGGLSVVSLLYATLGVWFAWTVRYFDEIPHPFGAAVPWARALGYVAFVPLSVIVLPAPRLGTLVLQPLGIARDRALTFHRILGSAAVVLSLVHGYAMVIAYLTDSFPKAEMLLSTRALEINGLAGTALLVLFTVLGVGALPMVRRRWYQYFLYSHWLALPALVLSVLHVTTEYPFLLMVGAPAIVWAVDLGLYCRQYYTRVQLVECKVIDGEHCEMVLQLPDAVGKESVHFRGGQFVSLGVDSISMVTHPISIASGPPPTSAGDCDKRRDMSLSSHSDSFSKSSPSAASAPPVPTVPAATDGAAYLPVAVDDSSVTGHPTPVLTTAIASPPPVGAPPLDTSVDAEGGGDDSNGGVLLIVKKSGRKAGWSSRLYEDIAAGRISSSSGRVRVTGPVGQLSIRAEAYDLLVLVAGGVGVTPMMSMFAEAYNRRQSALSHSPLPNGTPNHQYVRMIWSCRSAKLATSVVRRIQRFAEAPFATVEIYLTKTSATTGSSEVEAAKAAAELRELEGDILKANSSAAAAASLSSRAPAAVAHPTFKLTFSRPSIEDIIRLATGESLWNAQQQQQDREFCVAVSVCGPSTLVDATQMAVRAVSKAREGISGGRACTVPTSDPSPHAAPDAPLQPAADIPHPRESDVKPPAQVTGPSRRCIFHFDEHTFEF